MYITENGIGGAVFGHVSEDEWKDFGISRVGLINIRRITTEKVQSLYHTTPSSPITTLQVKKNAAAHDQQSSHPVSDPSLHTTGKCDVIFYYS